MRYVSPLKTLACIVVVTIIIAFMSKKLNHTDILVVFISILTAYFVSDWVCKNYIMFPL